MLDATLLQDAMGLIDEAYIDEIHQHRPALSLRRRIMRAGAVAACFCLAVGASLLVGQSHRRIAIKSADDYSSVSVVIADQNIIWAIEESKPTSAISSESATYSSTADSLSQMIWSGWEISYDLNRALNTAEAGSCFAIRVQRKYHYNDLMRFSYAGKTRGEWEAEHAALQARQRKLGEFSKAAHLLKYGETLYTTGTPDGVKWTRELYEKEMDFYGEYLTEQYLRDGEFLEEKLKEDMAKNEIRLHELQLLLIDLEDAYVKAEAEVALPHFTAHKINAQIRNGELYLFATKEQLSAIAMSTLKKSYTLSLASRRTFESDTNQLPVDIDADLSGFDYEKITFYTDGVRYTTVNSDTEVLEAMRYLLSRWQYKAESLTVSIYCDPPLTEQELASMRYRSAHISQYTNLIMLTVPMEDLSPEAIRDLSLLPQVTSIHIGPSRELQISG